MNIIDLITFLSLRIAGKELNVYDYFGFPVYFLICVISLNDISAKYM